MQCSVTASCYLLHREFTHWDRRRAKAGFEQSRNPLVPDLTVPTPQELAVQHERAVALGARLLQDRLDDPEEPLRVYADPAGHPFCIFAEPPELGGPGAEPGGQTE